MERYVELTRGNVRGCGTSKAEARKSLDAAVDWLCQFPAPHVETLAGVTAIVYAAGDRQFVYQIVADTSIDRVQHGTCLFGANTMREAIDVAKSAALQRAWTPALEDDSAFIARANLPADEAARLARLFARYRASDREAAA